jgi:hypothetical protein
MLGNISKNTLIESIVVNDINYTQPSEIAELFNEHFTNVGHDLAHQIPPIQDQPDKFIPETSTVYTFKTTEPNEVLIAINKLAATKASGMDKLPTKILKMAAPIISESLASIFNVSLKNGFFPNDLKVAKVSPVFKTGDGKDRNNYRPISVLPVVSKIFEKLVFSTSIRIFYEGKYVF